MAQTRRKRKRRHRGTQAGTIDRAGRTSKPATSSRSGTSKPKSSRPASRDDARQTARERRQARLDTPPTWRGSVNRAAFAAVILVVFVTLTTGRPAQGLVMGVLALAIYIPLSFYTDRALYRRRQRQKQRSGR